MAAARPDPGSRGRSIRLRLPVMARQPLAAADIAQRRRLAAAEVGRQRTT